MEFPDSEEVKVRRDSDEMSIASDFSIIPESMVGQDEEQLSHHSLESGQSLVRSDVLQPSSGAENKFGKVIFQSLQATYTSDSDIAVSYILTENITAKSSDRVALYKVGFHSPQDYLCYEWASNPTKDHTENRLPLTVVFKASSLPKDVGEFFQFCYVTHEGHIVGVSTPLQLHSVGALSAAMCEMTEADEEGLVFVCTNESILHDKVISLSRLTEELQNLSFCQVQQLEKVKQEKDVASTDLNLSQNKLKELEMQFDRLIGEKNELMGRIGQVVEEKGHLADKLKTMDKSYASVVLKIAQLDESLSKVEAEKAKLESSAAKAAQHQEQLELALTKCQNELSATEIETRTLALELQQTKEERDKVIKEFEMWTSSSAHEKDELNSLAVKFSTVNDELITKIEEVDRLKRMVCELEGKLAYTVIEMISLKDECSSAVNSLAVSREEKRISEERQAVIAQDNDQLKSAIVDMKQKIEDLEDSTEACDHKCEAAEKIAGDLSSRLQAAKAEYQALSITNLRLTKKIKKLRREMPTDNKNIMIESSSSQGSTWLQVDEADEEEEGEEDSEDRVLSEAMMASVISTSCTSCSHSTQQLSEEVNRNMSGMVKELTMQMDSLKAKLSELQESSMSSSVSASVFKKDASVDTEEVGTCVLDCTKANESQEQVAQDEGLLSGNEAGVVDRKELYINSFLPTHPTAPVFLPVQGHLARAEEHGELPQPSAPSPTTSMFSVQGQIHCISDVIPAPPTLVVPLPIVVGASTLPPPLLPETTVTARQAAVMSQFTQHSTGHESDDDDFHSTSDPADPTTNINSMEYANGGVLECPLLECPLCQLSFQPGAIRLLEDHMDSHLEHVCPVCSIVFQRNNLERFEGHVQGHFTEEENNTNDDNPLDNSGPWAHAFRNVRLLEID